jgi:cilia- and flagella-associated protein 251
MNKTQKLLKGHCN